MVKVPIFKFRYLCGFKIRENLKGCSAVIVCLVPNLRVVVCAFSMSSHIVQWPNINLPDHGSLHATFQLEDNVLL